MKKAVVNSVSKVISKYGIEVEGESSRYGVAFRPRQFVSMLARSSRLKGNKHHRLKFNRVSGMGVLFMFIATAGLLQTVYCAPNAEDVIYLDPQDVSAREGYDLYHEALNLERSGNREAALTTYTKAVEVYPKLAEAHNNLGNIYLAMKDFERAREHYQHALQASQTKATRAGASNNLGHLAREMADKDYKGIMESVRFFDQALEYDPVHVDALYNKASALQSLGEHEKAFAYFKQVLEIEPNHVGANLNLGNTYFQRRNFQKAIEHEAVVAQLESAPVRDRVAAWNNMGQFLRDTGQVMSALATHEEAMKLSPNDPGTIYTLLNARRNLWLWDDLEELTTKLMEITERQIIDQVSPALQPFEASLMPANRSWLKHLAEAVSRPWDKVSPLDLSDHFLLQSPKKPYEAYSPSKRVKVGYLSYDFRDHPMGHLTLGLPTLHDRDHMSVYCYSYGPSDSKNSEEQNTTRKHQSAGDSLHSDPSNRSEASHLLSKSYRERFAESCDVFVDGELLSDYSVANIIKDHKIDVLVDLMAHTRGARKGIAALSPAPIIVNYLGYPGTMGSLRYMHYVVVDRQITPAEHFMADPFASNGPQTEDSTPSVDGINAVTVELSEPKEQAYNLILRRLREGRNSFTEKAVVLPAAYQANYYDFSIPACIDVDSSSGRRQSTSRLETDAAASLRRLYSSLSNCQRDERRKKEGLPVGQVVFCNFNTMNKMEPASFSVWMRILRRVPRSVLWLLRPAESVAAVSISAMRNEAEARGVDPSRLIFAERVQKEQHISRLALADIFIDSFIYNAHSTAADALWAHLPILTMVGDTFASRVAASLIKTVMSFSDKAFDDILAGKDRESNSDVAAGKQWDQSDTVHVSEQKREGLQGGTVDTMRENADDIASQRNAPSWTLSSADRSRRSENDGHTEQILGLETLLITCTKQEYEEAAVSLAKRPALRQFLRQNIAAGALRSRLFDTVQTAKDLERSYRVMVDLAYIFGPTERRHVIVTKKFFTHGAFGQEMDEYVDTIKERTPLGLKRSLEEVERGSTNGVFVVSETKREELRIGQLFEKALELHKRGQMQDALSGYERILLGDATHSDAWHLRGLVLYKLQEQLERDPTAVGDHCPPPTCPSLNRAIESVEKAVRLRPDLSFYRANLGFLLSRSTLPQDIERAKLELLAALSLEPGNVMALDNLGILLEKQGSIEELIAVHDMHIDDALSNADASKETLAHMNLRYGIALATQKRYDEGEACLERAVALKSDLWIARYKLAALREMQGKYDQAIDEFTSAVVEENTAKYEEVSATFPFVQRPSGKKVIAIYCYEYGQTWWSTWGPSSLGKGLGGSEEAVVFLSRALVANGYWVEIYGNPPSDEVGLDAHGVVWYPHVVFDVSKPVDMFVAWRYHISAALGWTSGSHRTFVWLQDVVSGLTFTENFMAKVHGVFCLSQFHSSLYPAHVSRKTFVTPNALDPSYFVDGPNDHNHFVYGSAPSRGLEILLKLWAPIRAQLPDATLTIYYGFTAAFEKHSENSMGAARYKEWKLTMLDLLKQGGVKYVGMVDHETLARGYASAGFSLYPTTFPETGCVSLMKAQAMGAIPITSRFARSTLPELTGKFDLGPRALNESLESDPEWASLFVKAVVDASRSDLHDHRKAMKQWARTVYQWERVAKLWEEAESSSGM